MVTGDASMAADGQEIYTARGLKVGLFEEAHMMHSPGAADAPRVVTSMGIVSCLGNDLDSVSHSLREGKSGIRVAPGYADMGLRSQSPVFRRSSSTSSSIVAICVSWEMPPPMLLHP